jgi:peptide/nickel transport system permease protein
MSAVALSPLTSRAEPSFVQRLWTQKPLGAIGGIALLIFVVVSIFAGAFAPYGFNETFMLERLQAPSAQHPFGTDNLGRDVFSRCLYGARLSVIIGLSGAILATLVSVTIGLVSGYLGGRTDLIVQRLVDAWMSFPGLIVLIVVVSVLGPGMLQSIGALSLLYGIAGSRIVRGAVISVRENMYVLAARAIGASRMRILLTHILPNVMPPIIVLFTTTIGNVILTESALSFLGLGVPPPQPTWGGMLSSAGRMYMLQAPWLAIAPGLCLVVVVYAANIFGDALRDLLDPRMRGSR